ncbi:hypothetical protein [Hoyosella subflava]|uniref:Uncharacterized protein n=1 Tax=Hoyosella subflava (strain DSM 45089 / JCM 17490 / NBRC 109087 / DQS3-9A1) TaxID=443218 RepID=F6EP65_HOYSD|nr:hypothetical protein [Hoyosella subflava]AEF41725.1 hypothetical protein AS9A_3283 [Hoyosella subflava DQS3-9A1]
MQLTTPFEVVQAAVGVAAACRDIATNYGWHRPAVVYPLWRSSSHTGDR